jgi:kumamolisin
MADKTHVVLPGSKRGKDPSAIRVGKVDPKEKIVVTIDLAGPKLPTADEFVGQTLTPKEVAEKFGAKEGDAKKVAKALKKFGLKVDEISLETRSMRVSGTAAAMEAAFKPGLVMMRSPTQGEYRGRQGTLSIPAELEGIVKGVHGLDQRRMARRKAGAEASPTPVMKLPPLGPADLERRYNFPPGDGAGQSIVIGEFGGGYFGEDTAAYCAKFNLPVPNVRAVAVDAPAFSLQEVLALPPRARNQVLNDSGEVMMDVQIIAGLCPKADISVLFCSFDQRGWIELLNRVILARPVVLSLSWGLAEEDPGWSKNALTAIDDRLNAARLLGITTCVAAGDDGSGDQIEDGHAHVDFPSSSPGALAVGGTMLKKSRANIKEIVWWESPGRRTSKGGGATGGGVSSIFTRPAWQGVKVRSLNPRSINGRVVPDVSALAGDPFYELVFMGKPQLNGGTSASAPLWAALIARINAALPPAKQQRFLTPLLYQNGHRGVPVGKHSTRDITSGHNSSNPHPGRGYRAKPGFDAATGWGVPDGVKLLNALAAF